MGAPPQRRPNAVRQAERDAKIYGLRREGMTERDIAAQVGISRARVHQILTRRAADILGVAAESYVAMHEDRLNDLYMRQYATVLTVDDPDQHTRAIAGCVRVSESQRKLRGADAAQNIVLHAEANRDQSARLVKSSILSFLDDLLDVLPDVNGAYKDDLRDWSIGRLQAHLSAHGHDDGPVPTPPTPQRAIMPPPPEPPPQRSPHAWPTGPDDPPRQPTDAAEAVLDALSDFEREFPDAFEGDDE